MKIDSLAEQHEYSKKTYWTTWRKAAMKLIFTTFGYTGMSYIKMNKMVS